MFWIDLIVYTIVILVVGLCVVAVITNLGDDDV